MNASRDRYFAGERGTLAAYTGIGNPFEMMEYGLPMPEPHDALIKITRANICGTDMHVWRREMDSTKMGRKLPRAQGHEGMGTLAVTGDLLVADNNGTELREGDRVVFKYFTSCQTCPHCRSGQSRLCTAAGANLADSCDAWPHFRGTFAEYFYLAAGSAIYKVPDAIPDHVVAGANCALAQIVAALDEPLSLLNATVIVQGAGGLGLYAALAARDRGASQVVVIDQSRSRLMIAEQLAHATTIAIPDYPSVDDRLRRVAKLTGGAMADTVIGVAGSPAAVVEGVGLLAKGGTLLEIGNVSPGLTALLDPSVLVHRNLTLRGISLYEGRHLWEAVRLLERPDWAALAAALVGDEFPLREINQAMAEQTTEVTVRNVLVPTR